MANEWCVRVKVKEKKNEISVFSSLFFRFPSLLCCLRYKKALPYHIVTTLDIFNSLHLFSNLEACSVQTNAQTQLIQDEIFYSKDDNDDKEEENTKWKRKKGNAYATLIQHIIFRNLHIFSSIFCNPRFYLAPKNHSIIWNIAFAWDALLLFIVDVAYDGGHSNIMMLMLLLLLLLLLYISHHCYCDGMPFAFRPLVIARVQCTRNEHFDGSEKKKPNWIESYNMSNRFRGVWYLSPVLSCNLFVSRRVKSERTRETRTEQKITSSALLLYIHLYHSVKMSLLIHLDNDNDDAFHRHTQTKFMLEIITHNAHVIIIQVNVLIKFFGVQTKCSILWICVLVPFVFLDKLCLCARAPAHAVDAKQQQQQQWKRQRQQKPANSNNIHDAYAFSICARIFQFVCENIM